MTTATAMLALQLMVMGTQDKSDPLIAEKPLHLTKLLPTNCNGKSQSVWESSMLCIRSGSPFRHPFEMI